MNYSLQPGQVWQLTVSEANVVTCLVVRVDPATNKWHWPAADLLTVHRTYDYGHIAREIGFGTVMVSSLGAVTKNVTIGDYDTRWKRIA